jgi:predicted RND superfamily exporter protein
MEQMYVQVHGNPNSRFHIALPETMRAMDSLKDYLISKGDVAFGFSSADFIRSINSLLHGNDPKFDIIPTTMEEIFMLMAIFQMGAAPEDMDKYMTPNMSDANVRLFLRDHKGTTLKKVISEIKEWKATAPEAKIMGAKMDEPDKIIQVVDWNPAGGLGGILAAANDLIDAANYPAVFGILAFTSLCCGVAYRSWFAAFIFVISLILANFTSYIYQDFKQVGLNINTIPVVTLAVGLGEDYGLYIVSQIKEILGAGASWDKAIVDGVRATGRAVFYQAVMMSGSVFFWWFSPLRFQAEMGLLLAILMSVNMIVGVLLLPAIIHIFKPRFMTRGINPA